MRGGAVDLTWWHGAPTADPLLPAGSNSCAGHAVHGVAVSPDQACAKIRPRERRTRELRPKELRPKPRPKLRPKPRPKELTPRGPHPPRKLRPGNQARKLRPREYRPREYRPREYRPR